MGEELKSEATRVGLVYDDRMCMHTTPDGEAHPECPERIRAIWNHLLLHSIPQRCVIVDAKPVEDQYLLAVHSKEHVKLIKSISSKQFNSRRHKIASLLNSIYLNEGSSESAYLAAGSVIEIAEKVARGELDSAAAIVRPPGHHAEPGEAMGFCLFNNVAVAASFLLNEKPELGIKKILIVDWDVHHGNGTQKMFWEDPRVLFFSVHRHDFGTFYPANNDGFYTMIGGGAGTGYNINVPWEHGRCGDADYLAVWDHVLMPIVAEFNPDIILVSAGFDAAMGDPLGGCRVSPYGYSVMLKKLMNFAQSKIVLALEGGYNLDSIAKSFLACMKVLLEGQPISGSVEGDPFDTTWRVIREVRKTFCGHWTSLADDLPPNLKSRKVSNYLLQTHNSDSEDEDSTPYSISATPLTNVDDVVEPLANLSISSSNASDSWRSEFSKIDVWYASYGSNMLEKRLLCYIEGGQLEGMTKPCVGSMDSSPPKERLWKTFPHRLFFGRDSSVSWGPGGVAFLDPESNSQEKAFLCLYRITFEQFNDILNQENGDQLSPAFDLTQLDSIETKGAVCLDAFKGFYNNVVYMGKENNIPILTMTCSSSAMTSFKSSEIPLCPPAKAYADVILQGLLEGDSLSKEEALAYIEQAISRPL